ncbi:MAG: 50S ribosomal protein L4 [Candidatus Thermoplasmatota archaeon]|nr:50S ribosomal protein L4 [Candidatus Thermoplasmatota archaeon]
MKTSVLSIEGEMLKEIEMPSFFSVPVRKDLINRAFVAERSRERKPYGAYKGAGKRHAVSSWGVGRGVSRIPRLTGSSRAAFVPQAVGGRRAHPPKVEKSLALKINRKEYRKALHSALAATARPELISLRGHRFDERVSFPLVVEDAFESLDKTKEVTKALLALGVYDDVLRAFEGRKKRKDGYRIPKSILIVSSRGPKGAKNITGIDIRAPKDLKISDVAPGGVGGRLIIYTESAVEGLRRLEK